MDGAGAALTGKASAVGDGSALADSLRRRPVSAEKLRLRRSIYTRPQDEPTGVRASDGHAPNATLDVAASRG